MVTIPTLSQLYTTSLTNLENEYGVTISLVKKVALRVLALVFAGMMWTNYKVLGFVQKNVWLDTADPESKGGTLERFCRIRLNREPFGADAGQYSATVTGSIGATIQAEQTFKSNDNSLSPGKLFVLDTAHVMVTASDTITLRALTAGEESKLAIGDTLTATSPIVLIDNPLTITAITVQPLDAESIEDYRQAGLQSFQLESQGMSAGDIRIWCNDVQGVAQVYPYTKSGDSNSFQVYVEATIADSTDGKGTPGALILADVLDVINFKPNTSLPINETGRRSINSIPYIEPVTIINVDITVLGSSFTASQETLVTNALTAALAITRPFVAAAQPIVTKNDIVSELKVNSIIFSTVQGAIFTGVVLEINGVPVTSYTFVAGNIPYLNSVVFA